jgi:5-methylcytosine-specific restriction endonuclease McrBC regulatory subunit McrC
MAKNLLEDNSFYCLDNKIDGFKTITKTLFEDLIGFLKNNNNLLNTKGSEYIQVLNQHRGQENRDTFILRYFQEKDKNNNYVDCIQTGNFVGKIYLPGKIPVLEVNIGVRFDEENSTNVLEFLLDYTHSLYAKSIKYAEQNSQKKTNDIIKVLISKLFVQSLSKAFIMGLPKTYKEIYDNSYSPKGRIDLINLISHELPFKGKTPHIKNERVVVESIALVLLKAIDVLIYDIYGISKTASKNKKTIEKNPYANEIATLSKIKSAIQQSITIQFLSKEIIYQALKHQVLNNPIYSEYKVALFYANLILNGLKEPKVGKNTTEIYGYVTDVSVLWENFLAKLIKDNLSEDWIVDIEPKLKLVAINPGFYNFTNTMYPDLIVRNEVQKKVMVFDAKFKRSNGVFDRDDFYKTVSYITYYQNSGYEVILSGQIYPDTKLKKINENVKLFESNTDFRFFGVDLKKFIKSDEECRFISIIKDKTR